MRVLCISANTETINLVPFPLGLNCVAMAARTSGHDVRVLDLMAEADVPSIFRDTITSLLRPRSDRRLRPHWMT